MTESTHSPWSDLICGPPYVKIGGAHPKITKTNESEGAVVRNRFKIFFTKTLKPCKIIFLKKYPPTQNNFQQVDNKLFGGGSTVLSKQLQPP